MPAKALGMPATALRDLVAEELAVPVDPRVTSMARAIADLYPNASRAVLFYGSCLRERELDGLMLDFYLIVSDYRTAFGRGWYALANKAVPPNVFPFEHDGLTAKYAVLSEADFHALMGPEASAVSVWARFAQPSRLVWTKDDTARETAIDIVTQGAPTLFTLALPLAPAKQAEDLDLWRFAFSLTYGAELRAERGNRPGSVVDAEPERYRRFTSPVLATIAGRPLLSQEAAERRWRQLRRNGKALTLVRLAKATTTFAGGIDYIAWKINRHAGTELEVKPWQRRWPILGALTLLPRLLKRGAIR